MQTVKTYRAYYNDGLFIPYEPVTIPKGCQVVVTVLDFLLEDAKESRDNNLTITRPADPSKSAIGLWEGEIVVPDDFNAPLEDLKEYMF